VLVLDVVALVEVVLDEMLLDELELVVRVVDVFVDVVVHEEEVLDDELVVELDVVDVLAVVEVLSVVDVVSVVEVLSVVDVVVVTEGAHCPPPSQVPASHGVAAMAKVQSAAQQDADVPLASPSSQSSGASTTPSPHTPSARACGAAESSSVAHTTDTAASVAVRVACVRITVYSSASRQPLRARVQSPTTVHSCRPRRMWVVM